MEAYQSPLTPEGSEHSLLLPVPGDDDDSLTPCLLYTSDAADERSSVDLGGRRIIKKTNTDASEVVIIIRRRDKKT